MPTSRYCHPAPYHAGSLFMPPPARPLDQADRRRWRESVALGVLAGWLRRECQDAGKTLVDFLRQDGALCASLAILAAKAGMPVHILRHCLDQMVALGLVVRHHRKRLEAWAGGRGGKRAAQDCNAYELVFPNAPVEPKPRRSRIYCDAKTPHEEQKEITFLPSTVRQVALDPVRTPLEQLAALGIAPSPATAAFLAHVVAQEGQALGRGAGDGSG